MLICACSSVYAEQSEFGSAKLIISNRPGEHVAGLTWKSYDLPVRVVKQGQERRAYVDLQGSLDRTDVNLVYERENIRLTPNVAGNQMEFGQSVLITGKITVLTFFAVDPYGRAQTEKALLVFPKWRQFNLPVTDQQKDFRRFLASAGLGLSYEDYFEPGSIQLTEFAFTGKLNGVYLLSPHKWELAANGFVNLVPVYYAPSDRASARWYGINGRIGYRLPIDSVPSTSFWLMTGYYMWGMVVNATGQDTYGVAYLAGPQIFVTARITPSGKRASWVYLKYASIQDHVAVFSAVNRELAGGGGFQLSAPGTKHPLSLTLDLADAKYNSETTSQSFDLFSASLGISMGL